MAEFIQQRQSLNTRRSLQETTRLELFALTERLKLVDQEIAALGRQNNPDNGVNEKKLAALKEKRATLNGLREEKQSSFNVLTTELSGIVKEYVSLTDPRVQLAKHFSNTTPFLLLPTRMETRFKTVQNPQTGAQQKQLWVRVYPDTCMVDTFDPQLSPQELRNAARFWAEYYAAGDITDPNNPDPATLSLQKAAWGFLVRAEGAGRAAWITQVEEAKPLSGSIFPRRNSDKTVILTIATEDASILADQVAIFAFFTALWRAGKDATKIDTAKAALPNAEEIIAQYLPVNFYEPLPTGVKREDADVQIALVLLKNSLEGMGKTSSWSQSAHVSIGPERFVLLGYKNNTLVIEELGNFIPSPLPVGFNPSSSEDNNFKPTDEGDLEIPEDVKWIVDFDKAVECGMGFRVNLSPAAVNGVDRLLVIGIRLSADESKNGGQKLLSELFNHHYYSSKGLSMIRQGTPTNNTAQERAGSSGIDDVDTTFSYYFKQQFPFTHSANWQTKQDGQWLAEWLGLSEEVFSKVLNADGADQADALNMNLALWHGTLGYAMDAMMKPVFDASTMDITHQFFSLFVAGRGTAPAIRIGNQPYGILPATAFKRQQWMNTTTTGNIAGGIRFPFAGVPSLHTTFLQKLYDILLKMRADWESLLVPKVAHVSAEKPLESHQQLLDILGLHPNSVEFHKRYLQTLDMLFSYAYFIFPPAQGQMAFDKMEFGRAYQLLQDLGYDPVANGTEGELPLLSKLYGLDDNWEHKVIIDSVPLSETKEIRPYTTDAKNYITGLIAAASQSLDALRKNQGFAEDPSALLFSFLKFSLEQGYFDTAVRLHEANEVFTPAQAAFARTEQPFVHMNLNDRMVESRYALLYKQDDRIAANITVADRVSELLKKPAELRGISPGLQQQMDALHHLEKASTARLERAFAEHLDCCSYRLDAWQQAITKLQLMLMRNNYPISEQEQDPPVKQGLYIGAYGWLENVMPDTGKVLSPKVLDDELKKDFKDTYVTDEENAGYMHAPSVNQAVTAAVLRNAFLTNGKADNNSEFAVNLSSERIRLALSVIEGIQNGQPLPALLGYKFERMLRDQENLVNKGVDTYIYRLRKRFPLNANSIADTKVENDPSVDPDTVPITAIEARNVIHGKNLINHVRKQTPAHRSYPFGFSPLQLPSADSEMTTAITDAVNFIMNIEDAIADLGMAESVHQVCLGNYDRAAGVLESYSNGNYPQTPDVVGTVRTGPTLTHRVGLQIGFIASVAFDPLNPRPSVEPSLNSWLTDMLPSMNDIVCSFTYIDRTTNTSTTDSASIAELGLSPIDLLYVLNTEGKAALTELDEVVLHFVYQHKTPRLDTDVVLEYIKRPADTTKFSLFEVMSLVKSLRVLVLSSANLKPTDVSMPRETNAHTAIPVTLPRTRVDAAITHLNNTLDNDYTTQILDVLNALPAEPTVAEAEGIRSQVDVYLTTLISHLRTLNRFGLPETGIGALYRMRQDTIARLRKKVEAVIERLEKHKLAYETAEAVFDPLAADAIAQLQHLEAFVTTKYSKLDEINLLDVQNRKLLFDAKLLSLKGIVDPNTVTGLFSFLESIRNETVNLADFDQEQFDLAEEELFIVRMVLDDLIPRAKSFFALGKKATQAATDALQDLDTLDPEAQAKQVEAASKAIFGEEFKLIPRYELDEQQQFEVNNAWNSADLLHYVKNDHTPVYEEPEEDWLHGVARVREKVHHVENCLFLRDALGLDDGQLAIHPVQLPFKTENYHWLALPFPADLKLQEGDVLLYTALTTSAATSPQYTCGFLVDEWTEVIPLENETTGLSFHYDRPNAEAPQTMLLVTPAKLTGNWDWLDIVDALHDTLDTARLRAVEPYQIDQTLYARYLPPLVSPVTRYPITIAMYLADLPLTLPDNS
jgi:hypothetical protein